MKFNGLHPFCSHRQIKSTTCRLSYAHGRRSPITVLFSPSHAPLLYCLLLLTNIHSPQYPPPADRCSDDKEKQGYFFFFKASIPWLHFSTSHRVCIIIRTLNCFNAEFINILRGSQLQLSVLRGQFIRILQQIICDIRAFIWMARITICETFYETADDKLHTSICYRSK